MSMHVSLCMIGIAVSELIAGPAGTVPLRINVDWARQPVHAVSDRLDFAADIVGRFPSEIAAETVLPDGSVAEGVWITSQSAIGPRGIEYPLFILVEPDGSWSIETAYVRSVDAPLRIRRPTLLVPDSLPVRFQQTDGSERLLDHPDATSRQEKAFAGSPVSVGFSYDPTGAPAGLDQAAFNAAVLRSINAANEMLAADQTFSMTISLSWEAPGPDENYLMYALPSRNDRHWSNVKTVFNALYTSNDNDPAETTILDNLPPGSLVDYASKGFASNATDDICLPDPVLQKYFNAGGAQAVIGMDPDAPWDDEPDDGIDLGSFDFSGTLVHEIGHHLGFMCELEQHEAFQLYNFVSSWDIFRLNATDVGVVVSLTEFRIEPRELRFGVGAVAMTWIQNSNHVYELSTGDDENSSSPDSGQSSHWATYSPLSTDYIGVMQALIFHSSSPSYDEGRYLTQADIEAFDVMGYDIDQNQFSLPKVEAVLDTPLATAVIDPRPICTFVWSEGTSTEEFTFIVRDAAIDPGDPASVVHIQRGITIEQAALPARTLNPNAAYTWDVTSVRPAGVQLSERRAFGTTCPADINGDGFLDIGDINTFVDLFLAQDPGADWNNDGFIDSGDTQAYVDDFLAGC